MENPAGFREDRVRAGGAPKESSDDLRSHSISGAGPLSDAGPIQFPALVPSPLLSCLECLFWSLNFVSFL